MRRLKIKSFKSLGIQKVYDIEMPTNHNFILANGAIAHNCEYAMITYACMFLKHHYPLEWWASILTNADEQEITGKFWPYVKDMIASPDINISSDKMTIDYTNKKIRAKIGIIRGMGESTIEPIVKNRPYKDIQDFVNKDVAGHSLSNKLILVGVLDSLFPPNTSFTDKLKKYADAVEIKKFNDKVENANKTGKSLRILKPKEGTIPEEYANLHPLKEVALKKSILPSMPLNIFDLGKKYSNILTNYVDIPKVMSPKNHQTLLINGERLRRLDEMSGEGLESDIYAAATCFVIKVEEFAFAKGTKRALKLTLDSDNYISEKVMWPDYNTGLLIYPPELKRGTIATIGFRKKAGKKDMSIQFINIET